MCASGNPRGAEATGLVLNSLHFLADRFFEKSARGCFQSVDRRCCDLPEIRPAESFHRDSDAREIKAANHPIHQRLFRIESVERQVPKRQLLLAIAGHG